MSSMCICCRCVPPSWGPLAVSVSPPAGAWAGGVCVCVRGCLGGPWVRPQAVWHHLMRLRVYGEEWWVWILKAHHAKQQGRKKRPGVRQHTAPIFPHFARACCLLLACLPNLLGPP